MKNYDPFKYCGDRVCCHGMCADKRNFLDFLEGESRKCRVPREVHRRVLISVNKNGIRREEFVRWKNNFPTAIRFLYLRNKTK